MPHAIPIPPIVVLETHDSSKRDREADAAEKESAQPQIQELL